MCAHDDPKIQINLMTHVDLLNVHLNGDCTHLLAVKAKSSLSRKAAVRLK